MMRKLREWYDLADEIIRISSRFAFIRRYPYQSDMSRVDRVGFALIARSASAFRGVVILVRAKRVVEARAIARSCIEDCLHLHALIKDGEGLVDQLVKVDERGRQLRTRFALDQPRIKADETLRAALEKFLEENSSKGVNFSLKAISKDTPFEHIYFAYSQMSDDAGHPSLSSLQRHILFGDDKVIGDFAPKANQEELVDTLSWGCLASISSLIAGTELFQDAGLNHHANQLALKFEKLGGIIGNLERGTID